MADAFLGEIRIFAGNFAPKDWAFCNGQLIPITQNTALYSLLGTNYGGDGKNTFALPNLMGRAPMHWGAGSGLTSRNLGQVGGSQNVTLLVSEMPHHTHEANAKTVPDSTTPAASVWANSTKFGEAIYASEPDGTALNGYALSTAGSSMPHNNMQPYLGLNFIICLSGIYPSRG